MQQPWDAIVVGSGFGGAVTAARLAEAGWRVLVLERGRRWQPEDYPRGPGDAWVYDVDEPHRQNGWLDFRWFGDMSVAMGAGVGGGSLIYGNVSIVPPRESFATGWPRAIDYDALLPHYDTVGRMLGVQEMPDHQLPPRYHAAKKGAEAIGAGARFRKVPLAVNFDPGWRYDQPDAHEDSASRRFINAHCREQGTCNHCGFCCTGCHLKAKNTLDLNYLAVAEAHGARILPLHVVEAVQPVDGGYVVHAFDVGSGRKQPVQCRARRV
ncbi:MAG: NAD(P)-binding protein, partial [Moraxellaceae bacterium]